MKFLKIFTLLIIFTGILFNSCKDIYELDKYQAPTWLAGKLYTQISQQDGLGTFIKCLELTGYDTLLDLSGSFTVFAPSDEAFSRYFTLNPEYGNDVANIPLNKLKELVKFHIIQDAWSKAQLQMLNSEGWIDPTDDKSKPRAFKRQTLLKDPNVKYWVKYGHNQYSIVDSTQARAYRIAFTRSRKYVPIFFREFFDIYNLNTSDYEFYFNRPFENGELFYAGGKLGEEEIFAENGFIYIIDEVVEPFLNAEQLLKKEYSGSESYKIFLEMIYQFPRFEFNREETNNQTAAREGKQYDSLYNLSFPELPFNISDELTGPNTSISKYTYVYHNGVYVPTDEAFLRFINDVVTVNSGYPHWANFEAVPNDIKQIIVNTHFTREPVYETDISNGFKNAGGSTIYIDPSTIVRKEYGSNCTFLGLNETVMPRAFGSVAGPVYLRPGFSTFMLAMQLTKVLPAITRQEADYSFYIIADNVLAEDSSLLVNWIDVEANRYRFRSYNRSGETMYNQQTNELAKRILNQVGISSPKYLADKEFIETLGGNYIIWDHENGSISGAKPNVFGFKGDSLIDITVSELPEPADNGVTFEVSTWFRHSSTDMFSALSGYPHFKDLLEKAGLYNPRLYAFPFLSEGEYYTVFIPSEEALTEYGADTLAVDELEKLLRYHFVRGTRIFTDGSQTWSNYESLRVDESSTEFSTYYSTINIRPSPDMIEILDKDGNPYITINEATGKTNIMIATDTDPNGSLDTDYITTGVIHEIDEVLIKQ